MRTGTWKGNSKGVHIWNPPDCQQGDYRKEPQRDPKQKTLQRKNRFWKIHFCPWKVEKNELNLFTVQYWTFVMSWPGCQKRPFWAENWNLKASPYLLSIPFECRSIWWTILFRNWDSKIRNTTFTCVNTRTTDAQRGNSLHTLFKYNSLSQFYFPGLFSLFPIHT